MKMIETPVVEVVGNFSNYAHDCLRGRCEWPYHIPVPGVPYVQLYVDFGTNRPLAVEFTLLDFCDQAHTEQIVPSNFIAGQTPEGTWYGVFKFFNSPTIPVTSFVMHLSAMVFTGMAFQQRTFFSEIFIVEPCAPLTKIKSCHPENATVTGFDINDIYYGLPEGSYLGIAGVRYFHIVYARLGKVRELSPTATFTSNLIRNFRTQVDRKYIVETELVPKWYKDYFLAVYSRGAISVNDGPTFLVDSLAFEAINDDDLFWKPYANLKKTTKLYYGCDGSNCAECCTPRIISSQSSDTPFGSESDSPPQESIPDSPADSVSDSASESEISFDENFRYYVTIGVPEETLTFALGVDSMLPDEPVHIDWGDGTVETFNVVTDLAPDHTYLLTGDYVIKLRFDHPEVVVVLGVGSQPAFTAIEYVSGVFTTLEIMYGVDCSLTSVNLAGMPDGAVDLALQFFQNFLTTFDTANIPSNVEELYLYDNLITTFDGASFPGGLLDISDNPLTSITGATLGFGTWQCQQCNLSVAEVNSILVRLDVNVETGGTVDTIAQTPSAPPSGAGSTAKASLISKSWSVTTD